MHRLPRCTFYFSNWNRDALILRTCLHFCTAATENRPPNSTFIVDYLTKECGLSAEKAIKASPYFAHIKTTEKLDLVRGSLKQHGFTDADLKNLFNRAPRLLLSKVDKTLLPKIEFLKEQGVSGPTLVKALVKDPQIFCRRVDEFLKPSIDFLRTHLGSDLDLNKALKRSRALLSLNLHKVMLPNIELLRQKGVSKEQIRILFFKQSTLFTYPAKIQAVISRIAKLNVEFSPSMLIYAINSVGGISVATFESKCRVWNSFGWSEHDLLSAFERVPSLLKISEQKVQAVMNFLVNEAGYRPAEIRPWMFCHSLEKRLQPRYQVVRILNANGLKKRLNLQSIVVISDKLFVESYVIPYIEKIPELKKLAGSKHGRVLL